MSPADHHDQQVSVWDAEAVDFDQAPDHGLLEDDVRAAWRALLLDLLPPAPARVADLGCGTGTLAVLLAEEGYAVDGVDFSSQMIQRASAKTLTRSAGAGAQLRTTFTVGDAGDPPLAPGGYDVVLCRHVLWALPAPASVLARWAALLAPGGRLVLVEGRWSNGGGLTAEETTRLVESTGRAARLERLTDPAYWGGPIRDERYVVVSPSA